MACASPSLKVRPINDLTSQGQTRSVRPWDNLPNFGTHHLEFHSGTGARDLYGVLPQPKRIKTAFVRQTLLLTGIGVYRPLFTWNLREPYTHLECLYDDGI
jgi:hypothetical protein